MSSEIINLNCPKCGSSDQVIEQEIHFGLEFKCKHCGTTSVLVMNNRLYLPQSGEKICQVCGRVAGENSRFCQCGKPLVRACINPKCRKEIPIDHEICDFCGVDQRIKNISVSDERKSFVQDYYKILEPQKKFLFALDNLNSRNPKVIFQSEIFINNLIVLSANKEDLSFFINQLEMNLHTGNSTSLSNALDLALGRIKKI